MKIGLRLTTVAMMSLGVCGCFRGYKSASELESDDRGPSACADSCQELGMKMTAFVLVERETSGCVCSPLGETSAAEDSSAAAAAHVLLEQRRQQQQRTTAPPTP